MRVLRLEGPTMSTPQENSPGVYTRPARVAYPPIGSAVDANPLRVGVALGDGPLHGVREVVLHLAGATLFVARVHEVLAESG